MTLNLLANSGGGGGAAIAQLGILLLIPLAMYFLMIRPQRRKARDQQALQSALQVGDEIMTTSGVYGFITGFEENDRIWLEIDEDVQIRVNRAAIQGKVDTSASGTDVRPEPPKSAAPPASKRRRRQLGRRSHPRRRGMNRRRLWTSLLVIVGVAVVGLALNLGFGNAPVLGLDLQGGVSVVLTPKRVRRRTTSSSFVTSCAPSSRTAGSPSRMCASRAPTSSWTFPASATNARRWTPDVAGIVTLQPVVQCLAADEGASTTSTPATRRRPAGPRPRRSGEARHRRQQPRGRPPRRRRPPATPAGLRRADDADDATCAADNRRLDVGHLGCRHPDDDTRGDAADVRAGRDAPDRSPADARRRDMPRRAAGGTGEVFARNSANVELDQQRGWSVVVSLTGPARARGSRWHPSASTGSARAPAASWRSSWTASSSPPLRCKSRSSRGRCRSAGASRRRRPGPSPECSTVAPSPSTSRCGASKPSRRRSVRTRCVPPCRWLVGVVRRAGRCSPCSTGGSRCSSSSDSCVWGMLIYSISAIISQTTNFAADARRCHRHRRVDRHHRRQLRHLLRAAEGRRGARQDVAQLCGAELPDQPGARSSPPTSLPSSLPPCCSSSASARCVASPCTSV